MLFPFGFWKSASTPPPGFLPTDLTNLIAWLDGSQAGTVQVNGSNRLIRQTDLSGNGVDYVPNVSLAAPLLVPSILNGKSLFLLNDTDSLQTDKAFLPFDPGWDYAGPLIQAYVFRVKIPAGSGGTGYANFNGNAFQYVGVSEGSDSYSIKGAQKLSDDLTGGTYGFLSSHWPGPISAPAPDYANVVLLSVKGTTQNQAAAFWQTARSGSIPGYFAQIPATPFIQRLNDLGEPRHFFSAGTSSDVEFYVGEQFLSTQDGGIDFAAATAYLLRWFGTLPPFVLCLGDSLTQGFGVGQANAYPYFLGQLQLSKDFANVGISGRTTGQLGDDWPAYASLKRPGAVNWVNLWCGTNDIADGVLDAGNLIFAVRTLIQEIQADGWKVRFFDIIPRNFGAPFAGNPQDAAKEAIRVEFNARVTEVAADAYVHLTASAPYNDPDAWMDTTYYMDDQVHQNAVGNQRTAQLVAGLSPSYYLRPDGLSYYRRPDGTSRYLRP